MYIHKFVFLNSISDNIPRATPVTSASFLKFIKFKFLFMQQHLVISLKTLILEKDYSDNQKTLKYEDDFKLKRQLLIANELGAQQLCIVN